MPVKKKTTAVKKTQKPLSKKIIRKPVVKIDPKFDVYRALLLKMKDQIVGDIRNLSSDNSGSANDRSGDVSGHALHMADVATDMYDREFTLTLASNDRELLHQIDEALARIVDGTYGLCFVCKKPVPATRLKALPHAKNCLKCQEQLETKRR